MADEDVTFSVKSSSDAKYNLTVPGSTTVADLKTKLSGPSYADIPTDRIRLIYSGRVLKDPDTLASVKIKDGHTVHLVKGAASNARQNPANQGGASPAPTSAGSPPPAAANVPTNFAAGTGNNPLAGLTGARYAGLHGLPGADTFGPDGGMGSFGNPEEMARMMDNPNFAQQMNEMMNNPDFLRMLQDSPMIRNNPMMQQALQSPEFRRMLFSPEMIRMQAQMQRGMNTGGANAFPAPGVTDTTPQNPQDTTGGANAVGAQGTTGATSPPPNPFAQMGAGGGAGQNPFAALFGNGGNPFGGAPPDLFGGAGGNDTPGQQGQGQANPANPFATMMQQMMQGQGGAQGGSTDPMAQIMNLMGGMQGQQPAQPPDNRPPEELYQDQLRQLNDMGFYDFDRNVQALRRSGGSVQGAIDSLLNG